jgi:fermentation-respiration switch protein FrsA (DUF1100 family)
METETRTVAFDSEGVRLVGTLHLPPGFDEGVRHQGVVVTGSWLTVKEQMADGYARRLAAQGFVGLTFDFRGFGGSGGQPRSVEDPAAKVVDIGHALAFLRAQPFVDPATVGGLGICLSAGMMAAASTRAPGMAALALVAPGLQDHEVLAASFGGEEALAAKVAEGGAARQRWERTGQADTIPVVSADDPRAVVFTPDRGDYYLDPARGAIPQWDNRFAVQSWAPFIAFDSVAPGADVAVPTLMVHSDTGANPDAARRFFAAIEGPPKEQYWMPGTQYDFYDREPQVTKAVSAVTAFLRSAPGTAPA